MKNIPQFFFFLFLAIISGFFIKIIAPYAFSIGGALLLAHLFYPVNQKLAKKISWAPAASTFLVIMLVLLPFLTVLFLVSIQIQGMYGTVSKFFGNDVNTFLDALRSSPLYLSLQKQSWFSSVPELLENEEVLARIYSLVGKFSEFILNLVGQAAVNIPSVFVGLVVLVYLLYFILKDGKSFIALVKGFIPLREGEKDEVLAETSKVIKATVFGTIVMGALEGTFGGVLFFLCSFPSAAVWGVVMAILTMIPLVGANIILGPAALYSLYIGNFYTGGVLLIIGTGGVMAAENILKPALVGNRAGLHPSMVVLSSLGAISVFGLVGFIVGPIVATLFIVSWRQFRVRLLEE